MRLYLFCQFHYFGSSLIRSTVRMAFYLSPGLLFCDEPRKSRFPGWLSEMQQWLLVSWTTGATSDACLQTRSSSVTAKPRVLGWSPKPEGPEPTAACMVAAVAASLWFHDLVWASKPVLVAPTCFNPESWTSPAADLGVCGTARALVQVPLAVVLWAQDKMVPGPSHHAQRRLLPDWSHEELLPLSGLGQDSVWEQVPLSACGRLRTTAPFSSACR